MTELPRSEKYFVLLSRVETRAQSRGAGGGSSRSAPPRPQTQQKPKLKKKHILQTRWYQTVYVVYRSAEFRHWNRLTGIPKNKLIKLEKKKNQEDWTLWASHGTCNYICMYINAVAGRVMLQLYLWHDFYNIIFNTKHKSYKTSESTTPPEENFWVRTWVEKHLGLQIKCPVCLSESSQISIFSTYLNKIIKYQIQRQSIHRVAVLIQADGHGESNRRFSLFMRTRLKRGNHMIHDS